MVADVFFFTLRNAMLANLEPQDSVRNKDFILLAVHSVIISLEMIDMLWCICRTFWGEGILWRRILMLLKFNFFFWCAHLGLTVFITVFESFILPPVSKKRPWGAPTYILLQIASIILMIFFCLSSVFVFGVLSAKSLYPPYSMQVLPQAGPRTLLSGTGGGSRTGGISAPRKGDWTGGGAWRGTGSGAPAAGTYSGYGNSRMPLSPGLDPRGTSTPNELTSFSRPRRTNGESATLSQTLGSATVDTIDTSSTAADAHDHRQATPLMPYAIVRNEGEGRPRRRSPATTWSGMAEPEAASTRMESFAPPSRRRGGGDGDGERVSFFTPKKQLYHDAQQHHSRGLYTTAPASPPSSKGTGMSPAAGDEPGTDLRSALKALPPLTMTKPITQRETVELFSRGAPRSIQSSLASPR